jgi:6-phosphogluconolactonase
MAPPCQVASSCRGWLPGSKPRDTLGVTIPVEIVVGDRLELARVFVDRVSCLARDADRFSLALPGGSVAEAFCPHLVHNSLDWDRVDLFWCDERAVPPDHPDSNFRLAEELLIRRVTIDPARVHRMKGEATDLETAAADYERELRSALGDRPQLGVALLGVGPDGHVCSLFPGHRALDERVDFVVAIYDSPKPPPSRLTLTLPALAGAFVVIAAFGATKAVVIKEALENPDSRLPVALAARGARQALFLLDASAAGRVDGAQTPIDPTVTRL